MPKKPVYMTIEEKAEDGTITKHNLSMEEYRLITTYFANGSNQTRAYMEIHPSAEYESARVQASRLFAKPNIRAGLKSFLQEKAMPAEEVLARLADMARANHKPFIRIDDDGFVYFDFSDPEAQAHLHLIKKIKTKRERRVDGKGDDAQEWEGEWVEVELHDAQSALVTLARHHKLLVDNVDLTSGGKPIETPKVIEIIKSEKKE